MKNTALKISNPNDEIYTPIEAIYPILPHIKKHWIIWECCFGQGDLKKHLEKFGYKVIGNKNFDFFKTNLDCDIILTNPPYSNKREFIKRAFELKKPFAFLVPLTTLDGKKAMKLFENKNIELIIPNKRINFMKEKKSSTWFLVIWLTYGLNIGKQINYFDMEKIK